MRLTLRNLLAYMDDLLDPESARIIGQKTEESEFASGLLHRIRDVTRRVKLGSPEVIDRKAALDPNTVAEYLDNTLPADRVTDFEKACLDSDVELAEVAACHQILTLVLGEPAEVRPESRVRMYRLPETAASHTYVETGKADAGGEDGRIEAPATPPPVRRRQPAVPEYLLEARRRRRRLLWMTAVAVVLCLAVYLGVKGGYVGPGRAPARPDDQVAMGTPQAQQPNRGEAGAEPLLPAGVPSASPLPSTSEGTAEPSAALPVSPAPTLVDPPTSDPAAASPKAAGELEPVPNSVVAVKPTPVPPAAVNASSETPIPVTQMESPDLPPGPAPDPGQVAGASVPAGIPDDRELMIAEPVVPEVAEEGREIGRLITADEMVLATDAGHAFFRVSNAKPLRAGQRVVSLPTSRPVIRIDGKLDVEMVDGGEIHLLPFDENGPPGLEVASGRMILAPTDEAGAVSVALHADGVNGLLSLAGPTTLVALEVGRAADPIQNPLTHPAPLTARLWGVSGEFSWTADGQTEIALESPMLVDLAAGSGSAPSPQDAPEWVQTDLTGKIPRQASGILNRVFDFEKEADLILRENAYHRRREVRELARQSLSWIEDFEPVVDVLDDPERYVEWPELIELLRHSIRRGPRTAEAVRDSMGVVYGPRGEELYELLWKYDTKELSSEAAKRLVQHLEDSSLACRVLAFRNLNRITGLGYYYRPEESEVARRPSVQRWSAWAQRVPGSGAPQAPDEAAKDSSK